MKIEYLIIIERSGIPIYSHCFGGFCLNAQLDDILLSGFLSALTTMPEVFGQDTTLQSVEMGYTKLFFDHTDETQRVMVIGGDQSSYVPDESETTVKTLFSRINDFLDEEYKNIHWSNISNEERYEFEHKLVDDIIAKTLSVYEDYCKAGENCLFDVKTKFDKEAGIENKTGLTIWDIIEKRYKYRKKSIPKVLRILFRPIFVLMVKMDIWLQKRDYNKKRKQYLVNKHEN